MGQQLLKEVPLKPSRPGDFSCGGRSERKYAAQMRDELAPEIRLDQLIPLPLRERRLPPCTLVAFAYVTWSGVTPRWKAVRSMAG